MRRLLVFGILIVVLLILAGLGQTALDPEAFTGEWYSAEDQSVYLFQDGLIQCSRHFVVQAEEGFLSGAYCFSRDSILLFAEGIPGLESEKELYLISGGDGSFLCDRKDGSGKIFFIRCSN